MRVHNVSLKNPNLSPGQRPEFDRATALLARATAVSDSFIALDQDPVDKRGEEGVVELSHHRVSGLAGEYDGEVSFRLKTRELNYASLSHFDENNVELDRLQVRRDGDTRTIRTAREDRANRVSIYEDLTYDEYRNTLSYEREESPWPEPYQAPEPTFKQDLAKGPLGWLGCTGLFIAPAVGGALFGLPGALAGVAVGSVGAALLQEDVGNQIKGNLIVSGVCGAIGLAGGCFGTLGMAVGIGLPSVVGLMIAAVQKGTRGSYL